MNDERELTYKRLIADLDYLVSIPFGYDIWVKIEDVKRLLADEFLTERRGGSFQPENKEGVAGDGVGIRQHHP